MEKFETGTGRIKVHDKEKCEGQYCCVHNPSAHHMVDWPMHWRDDRGLMERICPHGIGHPDPDDLAFKERNDLPDKRGIHGCDGCCNEAMYLAKINSGDAQVLNFLDRPKVHIYLSEGQVEKAIEIIEKMIERLE